MEYINISHILLSPPPSPSCMHEATQENTTPTSEVKKYGHLVISAE
jgi:hypothetical protein